MTAREKFRKGQRVKLTKAGRAISYHDLPATVVGFGRVNDVRVRVLIDGMKCPQSWHPDFWKPLK